MPFVRLARFPGAQEHHFEALATVLRDAPSPTQRLLFAAGPLEDGWQVVQVWTTRADLDRFNADWFLPALARLGDEAFPHPPLVVDFETAVFEPS